MGYNRELSRQNPQLYGEYILAEETGSKESVPRELWVSNRQGDLVTNKELDLDHDSMVMGKEAECMSPAAGRGGGGCGQGRPRKLQQSQCSLGV